MAVRRDFGLILALTKPFFHPFPFSSFDDLWYAPLVSSLVHTVFRFSVSGFKTNGW